MSSFSINYDQNVNIKQFSLIKSPFLLQFLLKESSISPLFFIQSVFGRYGLRCKFSASQIWRRSEHFVTLAHSKRQKMHSTFYAVEAQMVENSVKIGCV